LRIEVKGCRESSQGIFGAALDKIISVCGRIVERECSSAIIFFSDSLFGVNRDIGGLDEGAGAARVQLRNSHTSIKSKTCLGIGIAEQERIVYIVRRPEAVAVRPAEGQKLSVPIDHLIVFNIHVAVISNAFGVEHALGMGGLVHGEETVDVAEPD
jgi:hypothetical protein